MSLLIYKMSLNHEFLKQPLFHPLNSSLSLQNIMLCPSQTVFTGQKNEKIYECFIMPFLPKE